jgi:nicotinate-nucleotide adenylyltransferase
MTSKIGIYSGTFDPVHEGHVLFAQLARDQFGLSRVLFVPEEKPRRKPDVSDIVLRRAMITLAADGDEGLTVFDDDSNPQHTISGLLADVARVYPDDQYVLLLGDDVFLGIDSWNFEGELTLADIADSVGFIVGIRNVQMAELEAIQKKHGLQVQYLEVPLKKTSSSAIRKAIAGKKEPFGLNEDVERFIERAELYR